MRYLKKHLVLLSRIISEVVTNFPNNLEEITLTAHPDKVKLRNYTGEDSKNTEYITKAVID